MSARLLMILVATDALISCSSAMAFAMALFVMTLMGPFIALPFTGDGAILQAGGSEVISCLRALELQPPH